MVEALALFFAGLLAGEELVVRYGVRGPLAALDIGPHIRLRQGLIRTLRVLVPSLFVPALMTTLTAAILGGGALLWAAVLPLAVWAGVTFLGTVPINTAALEWSPDAPPPGWTALIARWERLDTIRTWAALAAFVLLLAAGYA